MKAAAGLAGGMVVLFLSLWTAVPSALGKTGTEVQAAHVTGFVDLGKSRGYELALGLATPGTAILYAYRFAHAGEQASYSQSAYAVRASGGLEDGRVMRARFPSLGQVTLRFHPDGKRRTHPVHGYCRGKARVTESGAFRGVVSLRGEDGYFRVRTQAARGSLEHTPRLVCRHGYAEDFSVPLWYDVAPRFGFLYSPSSGSVALLYAEAREKNRSVAIRAAHREGGPPGAEVQVGSLEQLQGMAVGRSAYLDPSAPGTLTTSLPGVHPATATLAPSAPFHGEASYLENSSTSHTWTGNLGISLPGLDLPLTGSAFKTSLCVVSPLRTPSGCDFVKPKPLRGARLGLPRGGWIR